MDLTRPSTELLTCFTAAKDGYVIWRGPLFKLGAYPDKRFSLNEAEADDAVAAFVSAPNDYEHLSADKKKHLLQGKLGETVALWRVGDWLHGSVRTPEALKNLVGESPLGVSVAFDKHKHVHSVGLSLDPYFEDAAVVAAFSKEVDPSSAEAVVPHSKPMNPLIEALQAVIAKFSNSPENAAPAPAQQPAAQPAPAPTPAPAATFTNDADKAALADLKAKNEELTKTLAAQADSRIKDAAVKFSADMVTAEKADPAEKDAIVAAFTQAVKDDNADKPTCFSAETGLVNEGDRTKNLRAIYEARPKRGATATVPEDLTKKLESGELSAVFNGRPGAGEGMTAERRRELLGYTDGGKTVLAEEAKK